MTFKKYWVQPLVFKYVTPNLLIIRGIQLFLYRCLRGSNLFEEIGVFQ